MSQDSIEERLISGVRTNSFQCLNATGTNFRSDLQCVCVYSSNACSRGGSDACMIAGLLSSSYFDAFPFIEPDLTTPSGQTWLSASSISWIGPRLLHWREAELHKDLEVTFVAGRPLHAVIQMIYGRATRPGRSDIYRDERVSLSLILEYLEVARPKLASVCSSLPPLLIYTDGAVEQGK
eukprot:588684-Amphidinium_carterae.1